MKLKSNDVNKKKILYCLQVSSTKGYGHLVRTSAIAKKFKEKGYNNILISPSIEKKFLE